MYHVARLSDLRKHDRFGAKANTIDFNNQSLISVNCEHTHTHTHTHKERERSSQYI